MPEKPFILEGEEILREGESRVYSIIWEDFTAISTGGCEAYINGSSASGAVLGGSTIATENTLTLPTVTIPAGSGGSNIVIEPAMQASGQTYKTGIVIRVLKPGQEG